MIRFSEFERLGVSVAAFSDRRDGDCRLSQSEGRARACSACGIDPERLIGPRQVHGAAVAWVSGRDFGRGGLDELTAIPSTDALMTADAGVPLSVTVADCVPVYLFEPSVPCIGLLHSGRQGALLRAAAALVQAMETAFSARPDSMHALIGPSAGPDRYEVSAEMAMEWQAAGFPARGRLVDLWGATSRVLEDCGLSPARIAVSGICTISDKRFFSYRNGDTFSRNMALMML